MACPLWNKPKVEDREERRRKPGSGLPSASLGAPTPVSSWNRRLLQRVGHLQGRFEQATHLLFPIFVSPCPIQPPVCSNFSHSLHPERGVIAQPLISSLHQRLALIYVVHSATPADQIRFRPSLSSSTLKRQPAAVRALAKRASHHPMAFRVPLQQLLRASRPAAPNTASPARVILRQQLQRQSRFYSAEPPRTGNASKVKFWPFFVLIGITSAGYMGLVNRRKGMSRPNPLRCHTESVVAWHTRTRSRGNLR